MSYTSNTLADIGPRRDIAGRRQERPSALGSRPLVKPAKPAGFINLDLLARFADESGGGGRCVLDELQTLLRAEHTHHFGQAVGGDAIRRDDADQAVIGQSDAGARVNDTNRAGGALVTSSGASSIRQPFLPGGGSPTAMSPPPAMRARRMPRPRRTFSASSTA